VKADRDEAALLAIDPDDEALVSALAPDRLAANGLPDEPTARARERAVSFASIALDGLLRGGLRTSPLGAGWSSDLDAHVTRFPEASRLESLGWIRLDPILERLGSHAEQRWAVVEGHDVLACLDLHTTMPPAPVEKVLSRSRRRGEVRLREVLEFRALLRRGARLPQHDPVIALAARAERSLGGFDLRAWLDGPSAPPSSALLRHRLLGRLRRLARRLGGRRTPRFAVALSGVDGAGKSTLARELAHRFERANIPSTLIWTRPGMRLGRLEKLAQLAKRLLGQDARAGVARVAAGEQPSSLASRRGLVGWAWTTLVAVSFLVDVRRQFRRARGVVLFDRHLLDALVTLEFAYKGADLRLVRRLIRGFLPSADITFLVEVSPQDAVRRKPDDLFGQGAVERQLELYARVVRTTPDVKLLDGRRSAQELAMQAFQTIAAGG
jgi:thymidylate kinase